MIRVILAVILSLVGMGYAQATEGLSLGLLFISAVVVYWVGLEDGQQMEQRWRK